MFASTRFPRASSGTGCKKFVPLLLIVKKQCVYPVKNVHMWIQTEVFPDIPNHTSRGILQLFHFSHTHQRRSP